MKRNQQQTRAPTVHKNKIAKKLNRKKKSITFTFNRKQEGGSQKVYCNYA